MARIISKQPIIGFVTAVLFGSLGLLLISVDGSAGAITSIAGILFKILGYFLLFTSAVSLLAALYVIGKSFRSR